MAHAICGDGSLDPGEECDDGGNVDGDGCSAVCLLSERPFEIERVLGFSLSNPAAGGAPFPTLLLTAPRMKAGNFMVSVHHTLPPEPWAFDPMLLTFTKSTVSTPTLVAREGGPMPDGVGTAEKVGSSGFYSDGNYTFWSLERNGAKSIWSSHAGVPELVAEAEVTPIPDGSGDLFTAFSNSDDWITWEDNIAFEAFGPSSSNSNGIYASIGGVLQTIAQVGDPSPNGGTYVNFDEPMIHGENILFEARTDPGYVGGIFGVIDGVARSIVTTDMLVPGSSENFDFFNVPRIDETTGTSVVFRAGSVTQDGIYVVQIGPAGVSEPTKIVEVGDPVPGHPGEVFTELGGGGVSFDGGVVVFLGTWGLPWPDHTKGIFARVDGLLVHVIDETETLDGKVIGTAVARVPPTGGLRLSGAGLGGREIAFSASFLDATSAVYLAKPRDPLASPGAAIAGVAADPTTPPGAVSPLESAASRVTAARAAMATTPPDRRRALAQLRQGVNKLMKAVNQGLDPASIEPTTLELVYFARSIASETIDEATARAGDPNRISRAVAVVSDGDMRASTGSFDRAVAAYLSAVRKAESA